VTGPQRDLPHAAFVPACFCVVGGIFEASGALAWGDAFILPGLSSIGAGFPLFVVWL
jgi:hypothetical protein